MNTPMNLFNCNEVNRKCEQYPRRDVQAQQHIHACYRYAIDRKYRCDPKRRAPEVHMLCFRGCPHRSMVFEVTLCKEGFGQVEKESMVEIFKRVGPHETGDETDQPLPDANGLKDTERDSRQGTTETRGQRVGLLDRATSSDRRCGNVSSPPRLFPNGCSALLFSCSDPRDAALSLVASRLDGGNSSDGFVGREDLGWLGVGRAITVRALGEVMIRSTLSPAR